MFGRCKICIEKDKQLADKDKMISILESRLKFLEDSLAPNKLSVQIPDIHVEADRVLTQNYEDLETVLAEQETVDHEANVILSGNY